jgi:hypothetical protein
MKVALLVKKRGSQGGKSDNRTKRGNQDGKRDKRGARNPRHGKGTHHNMHNIDEKIRKYFKSLHFQNLVKCQLIQRHTVSLHPSVRVLNVIQLTAIHTTTYIGKYNRVVRKYIRIWALVEMLGWHMIYGR